MPVIPMSTTPPRWSTQLRPLIGHLGAAAQGRIDGIPRLVRNGSECAARSESQPGRGPSSHPSAAKTILALSSIDPARYLGKQIWP